MSKTSDSYATLTKGVSQQAAHDRLPGQHWAQDNMISDPVRGLSRRHGSRWHDEAHLPGLEITPEVRADLAARREDTIFVHGQEYSLLTRDGSVPGSNAPPIIAVNKETRKFMPVVLSADALAIARTGISTVCTAGRLVLMASATRPTEYSKTDALRDTEQTHVIWVRGGGYSRTFAVTAINQSTGEQRAYSYTTMKSYYDGTLDTTDIPWNKPGTEDPDPSYNKKVNDRTNAYNSAVNKHIGDSAKDITPENIAQKLADQLRTAFPSVSVNGSYISINMAGYRFTADDGGNGEFIRAASRDVVSPDMLTPQHWVGKVMVVQPKAAGSIPYYMKAVSATGATGFTEVVWQEAAGELVRPLFMFAVGEIKSGTLYIGNGPAELQSMVGGDVPVFEPSRCGDTKNRPVPEMFGRVITHMRMFQDRLMLVAGSTVFMSKTGDYFNFFTDSMLTVKNDDPLEVFALGTEDDTITSGVQVDRNLVLFGKRYQYIVPGKDNITPNNAYVGVVATYEDANIVSPTAGGSLIFFCQRREGRLTMQQMQPGQVADRLEAFDVSAQLDGYLTGSPQQLVAMTSPSAVFVKTREMHNGFYVFSFLDTNDQSQRLLDSWSRWTFDPQLGVLAGLSADDSGLLAVTCREVAYGTALVLDRFSRETDLSDYPYMDSLRHCTASSLVKETSYVAYTTSTERALLGGEFSDVDAMLLRFPEAAPHLMAGTLYDSNVILTSPYMRDRDDDVILDAKLTISKLVLSLANSAAVQCSITTDAGKTWKTSASWVARETGSWQLNTQAVAEQHSLPVPVMRDNKTYRMRISSRSWLPLTLSVVEWSGQAFTSRR